MGPLHLNNLFQTQFGNVFGLGTLEVLIKGKEGKGLQLAEDTAKRRFNPVDMVKKDTFVNFQFRAAQVVVCSQKEVEAKNFVLQFVEGPFAHEQKIGDVFLIFSAPRIPSAV